MGSLLPRTEPLHRHAPRRRGLKATSLSREGIYSRRTAALSPSPLRGEGWGEGWVLAKFLPTSVGAHPVRDRNVATHLGLASSRPSRIEATLPVRGRAQGALPQRTAATGIAMRCAAQRHEPSTNPCGAVRGGRSGPAGVPDTDVGHFSSGQEPGRKARPPLTDWLGRRPGQRHAGCRSLWLLSLGQARESDPASGRRPEARRRRARSQKPGNDSIGNLHASKRRTCRPARKAVAHWVRSYKGTNVTWGGSDPEARGLMGTRFGRRRARSRKTATKASPAACLKNECADRRESAVAHGVRSHKGLAMLATPSTATASVSPTPQSATIAR